MQENGVRAAARPRPAPDEGSEPPEHEAARPEFGRYYYEHDCGIPYERSPEWLAYFDQLADDVVSGLAPARVLDAGCALGLLVEKLRARGVEAWGVDISEYAIGEVDASVREHCAVGSLTDPLPVGFPDRYDLVTCIEVVEHMPPPEGEAAIARLAAVADRVLFSSSPADYAEATHVNVQPPEHWSALFARHGLFRNVDFNGGYPTRWSVLYERASADLGEVVRRYDRKTARLVDELHEVRETTLRLQERVAHLEAGVAGAAVLERDAAAARVQELERELAEARQLLSSRAGRLLRAYSAARRAMRRES
jgi:SAM-dependent methyltransferase